MNLLKNCLFLLASFATVYSESFQYCPAAQKNVPKVDATVYINGGTENDAIFLHHYCNGCSGITGDMLSVTFKVGADVYIDEYDVLHCNNDTAYVECTHAFAYACVSKLVDNFNDFLCCTVNNNFKKCVEEYQIGDQLTECEQGQNSDINPDTIVRNNAQEARIQVPEEDTEPYIFFNGTYDTCTSDQACILWCETVCKMLPEDTFNTLECCKSLFPN